MAAKHHNHKPARSWSRPDTRLRRMGMALSAALLGALLACTENRISVPALHELEQQIAAERAPTLVKAVPPPDLNLMDAQAYRLAPRDELQLTLSGLIDPYTPTILRARVREDGTLMLPLVGALPVTGLTLAEAEQVIIDAHVPDYVKSLTVYAEVITPQMTTVVVSGSAGPPAVVLLRRNERSLLYALAQARTFGILASGRVRLRPASPSRAEVVYDLDDPNDVRRALLSEPLQAGDALLVEDEPLPTIYLTGLFNRPGPLPMTNNSSLPLTRAVGYAGGLIDFLDPEEATLWRRLADGRQARVKVNIRDILTGKEPDVTLYPGDMLDVPHTAGTRFRAWVAQNIVIGPFGVGTIFDPVAEYRFQKALDQDEELANRGTGFSSSVLDTIRFGLPNVIVPPVVAPAKPIQP